jgi:hypothetical protein
VYVTHVALLMFTALQGLRRLAAQFEHGVSISINIRSIFAIVSGS